MPTIHPRINITLGSDTAGILAEMAIEGDTSISSIAKELILEALERREDWALSKLATKRDSKKHRHVSHNEAWK